MSAATYELFYWPTIQGRGEVVRLVLEDAGVAYVDVARQPADRGGGAKRIFAFRRGEMPGLLPYAPPVLRCGDLVIAQTPLICSFIGEREGLAPADEAGRLAARQLALTVADAMAEVHAVHHPIASSLYYKDQIPEAKRAAERFHGGRLAQWLGYFEQVLARNPPSEWLVGKSATYADLALFQLLEGLAYAFPKAMAKLAPDIPLAMALRARVAARPRIAAYLASDRRLPFNQDGLFRYHEELDAE